MSNRLKQSLQNKHHFPEQPKIWSLSQSDWKKLENHLKAAAVIAKRAESVSHEEWNAWTSEFSEGQGFPSIIYHDRPMIIRPLSIDK